MIFLISLIPVIIVVVGATLIIKGKRPKTYAAITVALLIVYMLVHPSYLPKGDIERTPVPEIEAGTGEIQDRNRKPVPSEVRNAEQERKYREGLEFLKQ